MLRGACSLAESEPAANQVYDPRWLRLCWSKASPADPFFRFHCTYRRACVTDIRTAVRCFRPSSLDLCALGFECCLEWRRLPSISRHLSVPGTHRTKWENPEQLERLCYKSKSLPAPRVQSLETLSGDSIADDGVARRARLRFAATWLWMCLSFGGLSIHGVTTNMRRTKMDKRDVAKDARGFRRLGLRPSPLPPSHPTLPSLVSDMISSLAILLHRSTTARPTRRTSRPGIWR